VEAVAARLADEDHARRQVQAVLAALSLRAQIHHQFAALPSTRSPR